MPKKPPYHPFTLRQHQVPEPPEGGRWDDHLRWLLMVMNPEDPQLHFAASILSHALRYGQISEKQAEAALRMLERIMLAYREGELRCQGPERTTTPLSQRTIDHQESP